MAAFPEAQGPELLELSQIRVSDLEPLLEEEIRAWRQQLDWDFHASAELVRRFVDLRALSGYALFDRGECSGYAYYVCEENKGLIGDLYVRQRYRTAEYEHQLLSAAVHAILRTPHIRRIESQLMLFPYAPSRTLPAASLARTHARDFMQMDLARATALAAHGAAQPFYIDRWAERYHDGAAQLIAAAYRGHVDSEINDQYRSPAGARRFLFNIVQYPGCGAFFRDAAYVAVQRSTGRVLGMCLTSIVAPRVGHITQVCVSPAVRGTGLGYELMRQSLQAMAHAGCRHASLTVTSANLHAVELYQRLGFKTIRQFPAIVWDGF